MLILTPRSVAALSTRSLLARAKALVSPHAGFILDVAAAVKRGAIWEDTARTITASVNGPVGSIQDELQRYYAEQATTTAKLLLRTDGAHYWLDPDHSDDNMTVPLPNGAYNVLQRTQNGVLEYKINVTGGTGWKFYVDPIYTPDDSINGILATARPLDSTLRAYSESLGAGTNFAGVTSMFRWFRGRTDITEIAAGGWDTSSVTAFQDIVNGCSSLTALDVSGWDTSSATTFLSAFIGCSSLTALDVSGWDTSSVTTFVNAFYGCSSLTALDVSGWDTSSVTTFLSAFRDCSSLTTLTTEAGTGNPFADSPCTNYTNAFLNTNLTQQTIDNILVRINAANTSNGTFNQSGGSAPSTTGQAAITAMRARGWTVTVTGGF